MKRKCINHAGVETGRRSRLSFNVERLLSGDEFGDLSDRKRCTTDMSLHNPSALQGRFRPSIRPT